MSVNKGACWIPVKNLKNIMKREKGEKPKQWYEILFENY